MESGGRSGESVFGEQRFPALSLSLLLYVSLSLRFRGRRERGKTGRGSETACGNESVTASATRGLPGYPRSPPAF